MSNITVKDLISTLQQLVATNPAYNDAIVLIDEAYREAHPIKDIGVCPDMVGCLDEQQTSFTAVVIQSTYWDNVQQDEGQSIVRP